MYSHFAEAIDGKASIRAFGLQRTFCGRLEEHVAELQQASVTSAEDGQWRVNVSSPCWQSRITQHENIWQTSSERRFHCHAAGVVASQWLAVRLQSIAAAAVALVGLLSAAQSAGLLPGPGHHTATNISASVPVHGPALQPCLAGMKAAGCLTRTLAACAGLVGLCLTYALPITSLLNGILTSATETEQARHRAAQPVVSSGHPFVQCRLAVTKLRTSAGVCGC